LDTYFVFLRTRVLLGQLPLEEEQRLIADTKHWLEDKSAAISAYRLYLDHWGDWPNPWQKPEPASVVSESTTDVSSPLPEP
jgi:hypothetical protein